MNLIKKFKNGLKKSSHFLTSNILNINSLSKESIEDLENVLISSDIGVETTTELINNLKKNNLDFSDKKYDLLVNLAKAIDLILKKREKKIISETDLFPKIFMFIGVNGSGKTTSIGKIIHYLNLSGKNKILVIACDTYRAAAVEQLKKWTEIDNIEFMHGVDNQDPASLAYQGCEKAIKENIQYVLIDTAGRLSNNSNLLNQLLKINNVILKLVKYDQLSNILVLDGTSGSNMLNQVSKFDEIVKINGLIITKLDGTAKGGAIISIAKKFEIPIYFVGMGEKEDDLIEFNSKSFSYSLLDLETY